MYQINLKHSNVYFCYKLKCTLKIAHNFSGEFSEKYSRLLHRNIPLKISLKICYNFSWKFDISLRQLNVYTETAKIFQEIFQEVFMIVPPKHLIRKWLRSFCQVFSIFFFRQIKVRICKIFVNSVHVCFNKTSYWKNHWKFLRSFDILNCTLKHWKTFRRKYSQLFWKVPDKFFETLFRQNEHLILKNHWKCPDKIHEKFFHHFKIYNTDKNV